MRRRPVALIEFITALRALAQTTLLFRIRGRTAVSAAVRDGMRRTPPTREQLAGRHREMWLSVRSLKRAERFWPLRVRCLQHSLALQSMLARKGIDGRLQVGSRIDGGELSAHAWIEVGDYVLDHHGKTGGFATFRSARSSPRADAEQPEGPPALDADGQRP
jgi:hypothetical protein